MGCGQSAWDDEIRAQEYKEKTIKLEKIKTLSNRYLINKLDKIKELSVELYRENTSGSRYLFSLLDDLLKEVKWEEWDNLS